MKIFIAVDTCALVVAGLAGSYLSPRLRISHKMEMTFTRSAAAAAAGVLSVVVVAEAGEDR